MLDTLQVHIWHRTFGPFVCRHCEHSAAFAVESDCLRCDHCGGLTRFPRARIDHRDEIGEAVVLARVRGLEILPCDTCGGWGVWERPTGLAGFGPVIDDPCPACEGAGFVWSNDTGGTTWNYVQINDPHRLSRSG